MCTFNSSSFCFTDIFRFGGKDNHEDVALGGNK